MTMYKALHPRDDIDRLYVSKKEGRRGKNMEHESDGYRTCNWGSWYSQQRIGKRTRGLENNLLLLKTPVKDHQLMLMWKTPQK